MSPPVLISTDRLTPSYKRVQEQARSGVKKYRRKGRYLQLTRLKQMIPNLALEQTVDEVGMKEDTITISNFFIFQG